MQIQTINPATGETIKTYEEMSEKTAFAIIHDAQTAFTHYQHTSFDERRACFQRLHDSLNEQLENFAVLMTQEMGKPITQSRAEIQKCLLLIKHYIEHGEAYLQSKQPLAHASIYYRPLGVIFGIMPWNFPLWQAFRFAVPTLMAGNTVIFKHAPISTGCAYAIEALFQQTFSTENVFRTIVVNNDIASAVIHHPLIKAVTLTGSARAGKSVAKEAGSALKKVVLELGGSDPYLILDDADIEKAAEACAFSRLWNAGQVCIAAKRIIVVKNILPTFLSALKEKNENISNRRPFIRNHHHGPARA